MILMDTTVMVFAATVTYMFLCFCLARFWAFSVCLKDTIFTEAWSGERPGYGEMHRGLHV